MNASEIQNIIDETTAIFHMDSWPVMETFTPVTDDPSELAGLIDYTLLRADATGDDIRELCKAANAHRFRTVCINPDWIGVARAVIDNETTQVCTVVGFPLGANQIDTKIAETLQAIKAGAKEIDVVISIGKLKSGDLLHVFNELRSIAEACRLQWISGKVILETCYLTDEEIVQACVLARCAGMSFVKTSTGFGPYGAVVDHVRLMRLTVGPEIGVKASGGIRDRETAMEMVAAGASRIGTSHGVAIVEG